MVCNMKNFKYVSLFKTFTVLVSVFFILGFLWMVRDPIARPFYIDELVYCGQYLYALLLTNCQFLSGEWFWSVDSKQPLLFWIYELAYEIFPESVSDGPQFLIVMPRILSACFIFLTPLLGYFLVRTKNKHIIHLLGTYLIFLSSPFLLIHAQLAIVEPLLVFNFMLAILSLHLYVTKDSLTNLALLCFANFLLIMTKSNGLIVICGMAMVSTLFSFFFNRENRAYRKAANIQIIFLIAGYLFITLSPSINKEAGILFSASGLNLNRFYFQLQTQVALAAYYLSYISIFIFIVGAGILLLNRKRSFASNEFSPLMNKDYIFIICVLLATSLISIVLCSVGLKGDIPRYYIFSFLPLLVVSSILFSYLIESFNEILKSKWIRLSFLTCFICLMFFDVFSISPIFYGHKGNSPRIPAADKRQYFDVFSWETFRGIEDYILRNNAEIYAPIPPYMETPIITVMIGVREAQKRLKVLPGSIEGVNKISCDPRYDTSLILAGSSFFQKDKHLKLTGLTKIREYQPGISKDGFAITLYKKKCE